MCCATSAAVSMRRRNCSSATASRMPPNRPSTPATPNSSGGRGCTGENSGDAGSTSVAIISLLSGDRVLERLGGRRCRGGGVTRVGRASRDAQDAGAGLGGGVDVGVEVAAEDALGAREVDARLGRLGIGAEQRRQAVGGDEPLALGDVGRERHDRGRLVLRRAGQDGRRARDDRDGEDAEYDPPALPGQGEEVPQVHGPPMLRTVSAAVADCMRAPEAGRSVRS